MIKILPRYIARTIVLSTAMTALIIISILFIMAMMGEAKSIGEGDYSLVQAVWVVLMRMPNEIYHFSPLLVLLGSIVGLSILSSYRELAVMRSSGFSIRKIIYSVLIAAFILIMLVSMVGEGIGPVLSYRAVMHKENAKNAGQAVVSASGIWLHIGDNFIHIQQVMGRQLLEGVARYQFNDDHQLVAAYYAKTMLYQDGQWLMKDVSKTSFYKERTKSYFISEMPLDLKLNINLLNMDLLDPNEMSLSKLSNYAHYLNKNGLQSTEYTFNYWQRIFQPFSSLVMILLAIPFVLGSFSSSTLGLRIVVGIVVGFTFFILNALLGQLSIVYQIPTYAAALLPPLLFIFVAWVLVRRLIRL